jgi:hypothetical protein
MIKINKKIDIDLRDHLRKNGNMWTIPIEGKENEWDEYLSFPRIIYKVEGDDIFQLEIEEIPKFILGDLIR